MLMSNREAKRPIGNSTPFLKFQSNSKPLMRSYITSYQGPQFCFAYPPFVFSTARVLDVYPCLALCFPLKHQHLFVAFSELCLSVTKRTQLSLQCLFERFAMLQGCLSLSSDREGWPFDQAMTRKFSVGDLSTCRTIQQET